jgi:peptidoglycan hydrolase-like protein with peptidoglycan-binding domain
MRGRYMGNFSRKAVLGMTAALTAATTASMTAGAAIAAPATPAVPTAHVVAATPAAPAIPLVLTWPLTKQGNTGARVVNIQYLLNLRVRAGLTVDGVFGPLTAAAVRNFQAAQHLTVDGQVGNQTWPKLIVTVGVGTVGNADAIKAVQWSLDHVYGYPLAVDGAFGPLTQAAVKKFQARFGIPVNGIVQPTTWNVLVKNEP